MQWLTLLGLSTSFGNFLYNVFIGSFDFAQWNFKNISTIGKISGVTISLQIIIFVISNIIVLLYLKFHPDKRPPQSLKGPIYYGGLLKIANVLRPKIHSYGLSVKRLDAQFSQILGVISQLLIIIAASLAADSNLSTINDVSGNSNTTTYYDPNNFQTGFSGFIQIDQVPDTTTTTTPNNGQIIAIKHAALFAKTTLSVAILAIVMTAVMNIVSWLIDIWKVNENELIIYAAFKFCTRIITCYPCFRDKLVGADKSIDDDTSKSEIQALNTIDSQKKPQISNDLTDDGKNKISLTKPNVQTLVNDTVSGPKKEETSEEKKEQQTQQKPSSNNEEEKKTDKDKSKDENKISFDGLNILNSIGNAFNNNNSSSSSSSKEKENPAKENATDVLNDMMTTISGVSNDDNNNKDEKSKSNKIDTKLNLGKIVADEVKTITTDTSGNKNILAK